MRKISVLGGDVNLVTVFYPLVFKRHMYVFLGVILKISVIVYINYFLVYFEGYFRLDKLNAYDYVFL